MFLYSGRILPVVSRSALHRQCDIWVGFWMARVVDSPPTFDEIEPE